MGELVVCNICGKGMSLINTVHLKTHGYIDDRIQIFKKYGYQTLVIWEHETYNMKEVSKKILEFAGG
jgi:hypothetical protein